MREKGWSREFDDRSICPAAASSSPSRTPAHQTSKGRTRRAMQGLMLVARGGLTLLAKIGVMGALRRQDVRRSERATLGQAEVEAGPAKAPRVSAI
jgi:hypothetical protein